MLHLSRKVIHQHFINQEKADAVKRISFFHAKKERAQLIRAPFSGQFIKKGTLQLGCDQMTSV
ncbi:hypothetical protein, partial [uncultured Planococcus sp.]|uniref:hypothetical protein n=1 Tax=uncultured Planococcus sp. TaxID=337815 RepID=UPI002613AA40